MSSLDRYILRQSFGAMVFVTAALSAANAAGRTVRAAALYFTRGTTPWAAQVLARDRGRR